MGDSSSYQLGSCKALTRTIPVQPHSHAELGTQSHASLMAKVSEHHLHTQPFRFLSLFSLISLLLLLFLFLMFPSCLTLCLTPTVLDSDSPLTLRMAVWSSSPKDRVLCDHGPEGGEPGTGARPPRTGRLVTMGLKGGAGHWSSSPEDRALCDHGPETGPGSDLHHTSQSRKSCLDR